MLVVANKGAGKTPASKTFLGPLENLERDEISKYDEMKKSNKRKHAEECDEDDAAMPKKKEKDGDNFRFHPKTRILDNVTPEALILSLKSGDGVLVIVADKFKVNLNWLISLLIHFLGILCEIEGVL